VHIGFANSGYWLEAHADLQTNMSVALTQATDERGRPATPSRPETGRSWSASRGTIYTPALFPAPRDYCSHPCAAKSQLCLPTAVECLTQLRGVSAGHPEKCGPKHSGTRTARSGFRR